MFVKSTRIMNEDFAPFELAAKLKEKGYPQDVFIGYDKFGTLCIGDEHLLVCDAPTISQVLKWLREEKKIYCLPYFEQGIDMWLYAICKPAYGCEFPEFISKSDYDTYEQAAIAGIEYVIDNLI